MGKLLHISASPRDEASESLRIARVFTEAYQESHPGDEVEHWDLWDGSLPDFRVGAKAKMTVFGGGEPQDRHQRDPVPSHFDRRWGCRAACRRHPSPRHRQDLLMALPLAERSGAPDQHARGSHAVIAVRASRNCSSRWRPIL